MEPNAVFTLLSGLRENPIGSRRYRSVVATSHRFGPGRTWDWQAQSREGDALAGIVFSRNTSHWEVPADSGALVETTYFLHPFRPAELVSEFTGVSVCIWLPWQALVEVDTGLPSIPFHIPASPLVAGLRAFIASLFLTASRPTMYSDFLIEQAVTEMAFGVVVEASASGTHEQRPPRPIDRARSIMMIRRHDPALSASEIAEELHLSERQLQRIFAVEGTSPARELRTLRVELARTLLADPAMGPLSLHEIATHAGFTNTAAMRRAFAAAGLPRPQRGGSIHDT